MPIVPRLPRDLSGTDMAKLLRRWGYEVSRQRGSHLRLIDAGGRPLTLPRHAALRVGTLASILRQVADHQGRSYEFVCDELFG